MNHEKLQKAWIWTNPSKAWKIMENFHIETQENNLLYVDHIVVCQPYKGTFIKQLCKQPS